MFKPYYIARIKINTYTHTFKHTKIKQARTQTHAYFNKTHKKLTEHTFAPTFKDKNIDIYRFLLRGGYRNSFLMWRCLFIFDGKHEMFLKVVIS